MNEKYLCKTSCVLAQSSSSLSSDVSCPALVKLRQSLRTYFHYDCFQPGQLEATLPVMHGYDVVVNLKMPIGGGKTLCMFCRPLPLL